MRAADRFWYPAAYSILVAARLDFEDVIGLHGLGRLCLMLEDQFRAGLKIQPLIISHGAESGWLMPSHLASMDFYVLRVRSNLVEIRQDLDR